MQVIWEKAGFINIEDRERCFPPQLFGYIEIVWAFVPDNNGR